MAGSDRIKVIIKGKTSHAGHPQEGVDAIMAAADFLQQVSHIVSRRISPLATATINFGTIQGGSRYNVVPGEVTLEGTIRTLDEDNRKKIPEFIKGILEGLKLSAGIDYDFQYFYGYPVLDNWPSWQQKRCARCWGTRPWCLVFPRTLPPKTLASTCRRCPAPSCGWAAASKTSPSTVCTTPNSARMNRPWWSVPG